MAFSCKRVAVNSYECKKLKVVYERIKKERPWDIRVESAVYTTAKEKYMIKLISEGHDISDETIDHVVGRCYEIHDLSDTYVCWFGYILTHEEYKLSDQDDRQSMTIRKLNKDLLCFRSALFYPVDILSNPFGEWKPQEKEMTNEIDEVYDMIKQKWPNQWYLNELHKYTLQYLIKLIENGNAMSDKIKAHVISGCESELHRLDGSYSCCYGFLLKKDEVRTSMKERLCNDINEILCWRGDALNYKMNPKYYQHTGKRCIPVSDLRFRKYQTSQKVTDKFITGDKKVTKSIYDRIMHRDLLCPESGIQTTWQEQYLIDLMRKGEDIPTAVISHALEGCYTWFHLLTENYACCRGYIVKREIAVQHDILNCGSIHEINEYLMCYKGRVYHRCAEIPQGSWSHSKRYSYVGISFPGASWSLGSLGYERPARCIGTMNRHEIPRARPHRPAPPPPDHLDDPQDIGVINVQQNQAVEPAQRNDARVDENAEAFVQNAAQRPRGNQRAAPPPLGIEI